MPEYIPANPVVDLRALLDSRKLQFPPPGIFSVARYALLYYLQYLSETRRRKIQDILLPDYMCHEVAHALRDAGYRLHFYPLDELFDVSVGDLEAAHAADAVVLTHFYGRISRGGADIARFCQSNGTAFIEDCVHLPFPFYASSSHFRSDAKIYTLRKVYPVPYGATILLKNGQEEFSRFVEAQIPKRYPESRSEFLRWAAKQAAKKGLQIAHLGYASDYRDLSQDPLKPFNFVREGFGGLLSMKNCEDAVARRRKNYSAYLKYSEILNRWGDVLTYDAQTDVPYMFVICLREGLKAENVVRQLMKRGIPAALGLALDPEVLKALPKNHRYNRIVVLPIHQDIRERHIKYIAQTLEDIHKSLSLDGRGQGEGDNTSSSPHLNPIPHGERR